MKILGHDAGAFDGIYGPALDAAMEGFARDKGFEFTAGAIRPSQVDTVMNSWIATIPKEQWAGESGLDSPVNLALTITPVTEGEVISVKDARENASGENAEAEKDGAEAAPAEEEKTDGEEKTAGAEEAAEGEKTEEQKIITYNWELTNLGSEECTFVPLLLNFGDDQDFVQDNLVMVLDGTVLQANCGNNVSGTFSVSSDWGEGAMNFCALGIEEKATKGWLSNMDVFTVIPG